MIYSTNKRNLVDRTYTLTLTFSSSFPYRRDRLAFHLGDSNTETNIEKRLSVVYAFEARQVKLV